MTECPACSSPSNRSWGVDRDKPIVECTGCGTIYFERPIVQSHDYGTYYPYLFGFDHARFDWELDQRRKRFLFQLHEIAKLDPPGRRLLDIGAGVGYFCATANRAGWEASGVEASAPAIEAGEREFGVRYETLDAVADGSCSAVTAFHVLEHVEAPLSMLKTVRRKLAPRGVLVVHVPNRERLTDFLRYRMSNFFSGSATRRGCLYYPEHITGFTSAGLAACATSAGFELIGSRQASPFSRFHDAWLIRSYYANQRLSLLSEGTVNLAKKLANAVIDHSGELAGRGDWLIAHFRAA